MSDKPPRALLVEDQFLLALALRDLLVESGFEVVGPARGLDEAHWVLEQNGGLDVAVLGVQLGDELVWPFARTLAAQSIPLVIITADNDLDPPKDLGDAVVLVRPFDGPLLGETIRGILEQPRRAAGSL
jgi:DNA-binding response OmpR family regulator